MVSPDTVAESIWTSCTNKGTITEPVMNAIWPTSTSMTETANVRFAKQDSLSSGSSLLSWRLTNTAMIAAPQTRSANASGAKPEDSMMVTATRHPTNPMT